MHFNTDLLLQQHSHKKKRLKIPKLLSSLQNTRWLKKLGGDFLPGAEPLQELNDLARSRLALVNLLYGYTGGFSWVKKKKIGKKKGDLLPQFLRQALAFNHRQGKLSLRISCSDVKLLLTWYWAKPEVVLSLPKRGRKSMLIGSRESSQWFRSEHEVLQQKKSK